MKTNPAAQRMMFDARAAALLFLSEVVGPIPIDYAKGVELLTGIYGIHECDALQIMMSIPHGAIPKFNSNLFENSRLNTCSQNPLSGV